MFAKTYDLMKKELSQIFPPVSKKLISSLFVKNILNGYIYSFGDRRMHYIKYVLDKQYKHDTM